ncbi:MAG: hypothetical protein J6R52_01545 [Alphaproteobacteria bacterium]|nr:hypothetical protein [Alphaproteobacteria bacterium]
MAQKCIFCGNKPQQKNKEHVIPQWLSKYLGRYNSVCTVPGATDYEITFAKLTFPACKACNDADSKLEGEAKAVVEKLMNSKSVTGQEISTLMDWFDKLRVGLWLGQLTLQKKLDLMDPNFYINDRVGAKDRMLIIERVKDMGNGLGLVGNDTNIFLYSPCVFQVWFNDILITNASTDGLVSGKLGFPRLSKLTSTGYRGATATLTKGINRTVHPVVMNIDGTNKTVLYQPIFKQYTPNPFYDVPYVQQHCYDINKGLGGIFVQKNGNAIQYMKPDDKITLLPKAQPKNNVLDSMKRVYELQNHVITKLNDTESHTSAVQQMIKASLLQNQVIIKRIEKAK